MLIIGYLIDQYMRVWYPIWALDKNAKISLDHLNPLKFILQGVCHIKKKNSQMSVMVKNKKNVMTQNIITTEPIQCVCFDNPHTLVLIQEWLNLFRKLGITQ